MCWEADPKTLCTWNSCKRLLHLWSRKKRNQVLAPCRKPRLKSRPARPLASGTNVLSKPGQLDIGSASGKDAGISWITFLCLALLHFCEGTEEGLTASELSRNFVFGLCQSMTSVSNDLVVLSSAFRRLPLLHNTPSLLKHLGNMGHVSPTCPVLIFYLTLLHSLLRVCDEPQGETSRRISSNLSTECPCAVTSQVLCG